MTELLWIVPALPFLGAIILITLGTKLSRAVASFVGAGSVGLSALLVILIGLNYAPSSGPFRQVLWQWIDVAGLSPAFGFHLDSLSLVFIFVITFVGFLIHVYSTEFMAEDEGFARFFAYLNLFVASMLILVLADNLVLMYLGWEGVGLCSYLLIGFWYEEKKNGDAARKAFIVTRVGDTAMAIGLFMLFDIFGTLNIKDILEQAPQLWSVGSQTAMAVALLLLGGAVGKSAQLPLQTWLPDAMAGPSPVSALIHAATMVTAGVYLIARMHVIFELSPTAQLCVGIIGALTLLIAGFSALTQFDLKRVLAYSTISQIGYMFLALGVGAWSAAIFHFMIHAFFKALLFLGAGAVIMVLHHEHDMF
jgi:NADH-quinone oxidoreductase subunit L